MLTMVRNPKPSPIKEADEEVQDMCDKVKEQVQETTSKSFSDFKASSYRTLVDYVQARIVIFIKVQVSDSDFIHLRMHRNLPSKHGEVIFEQLLDAKQESDPLDAFEPKTTEIETKIETEIETEIVEADTVEADTVEAGTVEAGTVKADTAEADTVEAGTVEAGTVEADNL